jgi:hypothetical protein
MTVTEPAPSSSSEQLGLRAKIRELLEDPAAPIDPADPDRELLEHSAARSGSTWADPWVRDAVAQVVGDEPELEEPHGCHTGEEGPCSRCADLAELDAREAELRALEASGAVEVPGQLGLDLYDGLPPVTRAPWEDEGSRARPRT